MSTFRRASTNWKGPYHGGRATVKFASSGLGPFEEAPATTDQQPAGQTSPMELLAAAESSCVCGMIAFLLERTGHVAQEIESTAEVELDGASIPSVRLHVVGTVPGLTVEQFTALAERAKDNCPVSKALFGTTITIAAEMA
jgi:lipoyl-dependent peroxiredoxin